MSIPPPSTWIEPVPSRTLDEVLHAYPWPGEAIWRYREYQAMVRHSFEAPILEVGCGSGSFTDLLLGEKSVDVAIDIDRGAVMRAERSGKYPDVRLADLRDLPVDLHDRFGTVLANCVLEHIPDLPEALQGATSALRQGGTLVATVPPKSTNRSLLLRSQRYVRRRQRLLEHHNLLSADEWSDAISAAGLDLVACEPYLLASECRRWDAIDLLGYAGLPHARLGGLWRRVFAALPAGSQRRLAHAMALLARRLRHGVPDGEACAVLLLARRSRGIDE